MASEALSIPIDIPWLRLAWSRDMLDRRGSGMPPKWRSSVTVSGHLVPLEHTEEEYPDSRVLYLKVSASITGWSEHEALPGAPQLPEGLDPWQTEAWEDLYNQEWLGAYWPCMTAILQVAVYPREAGGVAVGDDDYPHIVDFEPKKRELYEAVTSTGEVMSGSNNRLQVQKGNTSTRGTESAMSAEAGFSVAGVGAGLNITQRSMSSFETVNMTTTDASAEKRESAGFSTSLSQMYQLFNGYHVGTNRAVFVIVGRPHTVTDAAQVDNNLINGERVLEGVQEVFLVVNVPRTLDGVCVEAWLDTGHKHKTTETSGWPLDFPTPTVITRRIVGGCSTIVSDRLVPLPAGGPPLPPMVVGEPVIDPGPAFGGLSPGEVAMRSAADQVAVANRLNLLQAKIRSAALAASATSIYRPRFYGETEAFRARVANGLRRSTRDLASLRTLGYVETDDEQRELQSLGITSAGQLFENRKGTPKVIETVRTRLLDAVVAAFNPQP